MVIDVLGASSFFPLILFQNDGSLTPQEHIHILISILHVGSKEEESHHFSNKVGENVGVPEWLLS